jgi:hypothetical protein
MELVDHERRFPQLIRTIENTILGEQSGGYQKHKVHSWQNQTPT